MSKAPIAQALLALRGALIDSALKSATNRKEQPCFTDYNPDKPGDDPGYSFKIAMTYLKDVNNSLEIKVWILDLTGGEEVKASTGNTLTVTFAQSGAKEIQMLKDDANKLCTLQDRDKPLCIVASNAFDMLLSPPAIRAEELTKVNDALRSLCAKQNDKDPDSADCLHARAIVKAAQSLIYKGLNDY